MVLRMPILGRDSQEEGQVEELVHDRRDGASIRYGHGAVGRAEIVLSVDYEKGRLESIFSCHPTVLMFKCMNEFLGANTQLDTEFSKRRVLVRKDYLMGPAIHKKRDRSSITIQEGSVSKNA